MNYLESHDRLRLLEFHVLHVTLDVKIAAGSVVLRPLHVIAVAYQADMYVPVQSRRDRISEMRHSFYNFNILAKSARKSWFSYVRYALLFQLFSQISYQRRYQFFENLLVLRNLLDRQDDVGLVLRDLHAEAITDRDRIVADFAIR
jgi:hypothetical protein